MIISSTKNEQIKHLRQLQTKSKTRIEDKHFVVEGAREIKMAIASGIDIQKVFINSSTFDKHLEFNDSIELVEISNKVYEYIAYRSTTEGVIAICKTPSHKLEDLVLNTSSPLVLILESPEKPGNIGAILRTADAANIDAIIIAEPLTDLYNPNTIRSSLGAIFTTPIATATNKDAYEYINTHNINGFIATLQNSNYFGDEDYRPSTAFIMGNEASGLSAFWRNHSNIKAVNIPMKGKLDSLNLSVSTAILTYEALRQRT